VSRKFAERVNAERIALRCVNDRFPGSKLHGLSPRAIAAWEQSLDWTSVTGLRRSVLDHLYKIGAACQAMADQSRHAFDAAAFDPMTVNNEILALRKSFAGILE
jgi:hypothetical protein